MKLNNHKKNQKDYYDNIELDEYEKSRKVKRNQKRKLVAQLELTKTPKGAKVLDVGCGTGIHLMWLSEMNYDVTGTDLSSGLLEKLGERLRSKGYNDIKLKVGDAERVPFEDDTFDHTMCTALLHHVPHPKKVLKEMLRVTKPGGWVSFAEPNIMNPWILINVFRYWKIDKKALTSFVFKLRSDFEEAGAGNIIHKRTVFAPPVNVKPLIKFCAKLEPHLERIPLVNLMGGIIIMAGRKKEIKVLVPEKLYSKAKVILASKGQTVADFMKSSLSNLISESNDKVSE